MERALNRLKQWRAIATRCWCGETRSVDDQVQWLDNRHLMYGVPRLDTAPAIDVHSFPTDGQLPPLLIEIENVSSRVHRTAGEVSP